MNELFNLLQPAGEILKKEVELSAIHMTRKVKTSTETTRRLTVGHEIEVRGNEIVDCETPTHRIIGCYGSLDGCTLSFLLVDLVSGMPVEMRVK